MKSEERMLRLTSSFARCFSFYFAKLSPRIYRTREFGDVLALGIRRGEGADAHPVLLGEGDPLHNHVLDPAVVLVPQHLAASRAQVALDVDAVLLPDLLTQFLGDQVERLLVHRAALDGVDRSRLRP